MKKSISAGAIVGLILVIAVSAQSQPKVRDSMIVTTDWLAKHLQDDSLILFQVGDQKEYEAAHIPGAQFIQTGDISTPRGTGLLLELPPLEQLKAAFEKFGLTDRSRIVIYFSKDWITPTARVYFTLDYLGFGDRTSILDGGLPAWRAAGQPVTAEVKAVKPGSFNPHPNAKLVVDAAWVSANLNNPPWRFSTRARQSFIRVRRRARCRVPAISRARRAFLSARS